MFRRKTYTEALEDRLAAISLELSEYSLTGTTEENLRNHNVVLGSQLEFFLRKVIFPQLKNPPNLAFLINKLSTLGFAQLTLDSLHTLRNNYNSSKHDEDYSPSIKNTSNNLNALRSFIEDLKSNYSSKIPTLSILPPLKLKSTYWGFAWDHYFGGDTEISIFIPAHDQTKPLAVPSIDTIYIRMEKWDDFKKEIQTFGNFTTDKTAIVNTELYDFMASQDDFLSCFEFEGKFKDLINLLSKYELRQDLIPGLNRADSTFVVVQSIVLSMLEAIKTFKSQPSNEDLAKRIISISNSLFAVPENHLLAQSFAEEIIKLVQTIPFDSWLTIDGPIWVKMKDMETIPDLIYHHENIGLRNDLVVIVGF